MENISITQQGRLGRMADLLMVPLMYVLQGTFTEKPQQTHRWNNLKLRADDIRHLDATLMVSVTQDTSAVRRWWSIVPIFHMPIFGGWKQFVVLEPKVAQDCWFVGWDAGDVIGVSRIMLTGPVRLLKSNFSIHFFGVNEHGAQIALAYVGEGKVGQARTFARIPLL